MATDYRKYGLPSGAYYDSGSGTVRDANGNDLGSPEMFGGTQPNGPTQDWSFPTQSYAITPDYGQVQVVTGGTSQPNAGIGDFTTGAAALQAQDLTPGATSLEGVPTSFNDAQGNQQYFYGTPTLGGQTTFTDNPDSAWYRNSDLTPIQGIDSSGNLVSMNPTAATAIPSQYDTAQLNRSFLMGNAGVLAGMAGASALGPTLAGESGLSALAPYAAESIPIDMSGPLTPTALDASANLWPYAQGAIPASLPVDAALPAAEAALPSAGLPPTTPPSGLSPSTIAKMLPTALKAVGALAGLGAGAAGGSGNSGQPLYMDQNASGPSSGPWNTPTKASSLTWTPHQQAPVKAGTENLRMLYSSLDPALAQHLGQSGSAPSNLGQSQLPSYFKYGSQTQSPTPTDYLNGAQVAGFAEGGDVHVPEFITGETGHYVKGRGDGQSDDIPAMLADGEYVFDADTVAALGNGSSDAGAAVLDKMRQALRAHKRSAPVDKIPPKSKSPLEYVREGLKNHG